MGQSSSKLIRMRSKARKCRTVKSLKDLLTLENMDINALFNTEDNHGVTPLWIAVRYNDLELARITLNVGADINLACGALSMTPLHMATYNHNLEMVELLLESGADPNRLDKWNYTPLMYAAIHYEPYCVSQLFRLLIQYGAEVNDGATLKENRELEKEVCNVDLPTLQSSYNGDYMTYVREPNGPTSGTALHLSVQNPHMPNEVVEILLSHGANVNKLNLHGQTPLMGAILDIYYDYHTNVKGHAELLVEKGAKIDSQDMRGWTCLHYASQRGSITCMSLLMENNCDCNILSATLESPLWILLAHGWREAMKFLVMSGCDVNQPIRSTTLLTINQDTDICRYGYIYPIEFAICNRYYNMAELMVKVGAKVTNDTWLGSHLDPPHTRHVEFLQFLEHQKHSKKRLRSLKSICRQSVRNAMRQNIIVKLEHFTLPQLLKDYVSYNE